LSDYIQVFFGSEIDAISFKSKLNDINIYPVLKNETNSANLAGFGVPNYLYSHKLFIHKDQYNEAYLLIEDLKKTSNN
tara:strand:+ start:1557 stop:1790 length:234 start_codon:yes stop_codon:yes gene_type:complete